MDTRHTNTPHLDTIRSWYVSYLFRFRSSFYQLVKRTNSKQTANFYP